MYRIAPGSPNGEASAAEEAGATCSLDRGASRKRPLGTLTSSYSLEKRRCRCPVPPRIRVVARGPIVAFAFQR
jgi:hypothetical protein